MTEIIVTCVLPILVAAIIIGLLSRRWIARMVSERKARGQEAAVAASETRKAADREIYLSALSGRLRDLNDANRGNRDRTALVALSEICRRLHDGRDVPEQMILHVLSKLKGTEDIIAKIEAAKC